LVTSPSAKHPFLEDQFVSVSLASLLWPVQFERPYQEHIVPTGIACKVVEAHKPPPPPPPPHKKKNFPPAMAVKGVGAHKPPPPPP